MGMKKIGEPYEWAIDWETRSFECDSLAELPSIGVAYHASMDCGDVQVHVMICPSVKKPNAWVLNFYNAKSKTGLRMGQFVRPAGSLGPRQLQRCYDLFPYFKRALYDALYDAGWTSGEKNPTAPGTDYWYRWDFPYDVKAHIADINEEIRQHQEAKQFAVTGQGRAVIDGYIATRRKKIAELLHMVAEKQENI